LRATRSILRAVTVAVIATGLMCLTGSCRKEGPLERLGDKADRAVKEAGEDVEDAVDKVKEGAEDAADKVKEGAEDTADQVEEAPQSGSEGASGKTE